MRVLGVVPARAGSRGIPGKNIMPFLGKPLLAWTAQAALRAKRLTRVILSTDEERIAEVGRQWGLEVPFLRPATLAQDDTPTLPVLQHAVRALESEGGRYDAVCLLQPTNPLRSAAAIDACIDLFDSRDADAVVSVLPVPHSYNPHWTYCLDAEGILRLSTGEEAPIPRRQDLPPAYHRDGSVYVTRRDVLMVHNSLYGRRLIPYFMDEAQSVNLDTAADVARALDLAKVCLPAN
jgi:CMP-N-acetylneuraminic acid synthetase